ncbi:hypothetical protein QAO71_09610 [Halopseudomonas sp. SMJS2]|uniref:hypothetical protein n=1 Tax=Halopseudomonas sp. SMJS2 TaxID=3041098 RepID=UPI00245288D8|nr:hypothetical protein [Halopseudomonas sp. SMJS2]WGK60356.1 hypothetical protein QAO71_09610 [Halopseudomonas sp. SMJS2]
MPELLGLSQLAPGTLRHSYSEAVQVVDDSVLVMKAFITPQGLPLPPDLQQLSLQLPAPLKTHPGQSLVMDSDCFFEKRFAYDHNVVENCIRQLHDALLGIFKRSLTEEARLKWKL